MIQLSNLQSIHNVEIESFLCFKLTIKCANLKVLPLSDDQQYLCFSAYFLTNTLVLERYKHLWSADQQETHDNIKSLYDSRMGYKYLYL